MTSARPFDRIVVGLAEDDRSDHAVRVAIDLAQRWGSDLELVHATGTKEAGWGKLDRLRTGTGVAETLTHALDAVGGHLRQAFPGVVVNERELHQRLRVVPGHAVRELLDCCGDGRALVVLGPHRRRGRIDFGSTARALLATSTVPVWVQSEPPRPIKKILLGVDGSHAAAGLVALTAGFAASLGASVEVMHAFRAPTFAYGVEDPITPLGPTYVVDDLRREAKSELEELVASQPWQVPHEAAFVEGDPVEALLARQDTADLIVLGTHGRTRLAAAVLGSVAYGVLGEAHRPVLVVPDAGREWILPTMARAHHPSGQESRPR